MATAKKTTTTARRPATAKAPADRKTPTPPKGKVQTLPNGDRVVTLDGLDLTITKEAADDFELLDLLARAEREQNPALLPELLRRLVGEDGFRTVLDHLRDPETKRVRIQPTIDFINRILAALNPNS
jgi:hypothetical protein